MESNNIVIVQNETLTRILEEVSYIRDKVFELTIKQGKEYLTCKDVERLLKCGRAKVEKLAKDGAFEKIQTGGKKSKVLFKRLEIEKYLQEQTFKRARELQGAKIVSIKGGQVQRLGGS